MMKHNIFLEIILTVCLVFVSCQKDEVVPVTSLSIDAMEIKTSYTTADIVWNVKSIATINDVILEYSTDSTFIKSKEVRMTKPDKEENKYVVSLDSLENGTSYYIRCRAINKINSTISKLDSFRTLTYQLAEINTDSITQISVSTATLHATLINMGSDLKTSVGFYLAKHDNVSTEDSCIFADLDELKDSIHYFYSLTNLDDNVTYYIRAFAQNVKGVSFGEELSFITTEILLPEVAPTTVAYVSYTDVICKSEVVSDGGGDIIERGFCYSTTPNPTLADNKKVSGDGKGTFSASISGLTANTTYYVRAFARNSKGTMYGEQAEFKTKEYALPSVSTSVVTKVKYTTATCGGNVSDDGGQEVTEKGICYSTSQYPTVSDNKVSCGSGTGDFECDLSNLSEGTTYYVRAYAINSVGINYGEQQFFISKEHIANAIYYTASAKLSETSDNSKPGLHIYRFNASIVSHTFEIDEEDNSGEIIGEGVIVFDDILSVVGDNAFYSTRYLFSVKLPNTVTSIGNSAFYNCEHLITIEIPYGLTEIGMSAFQGCNFLSSIEIPNSVIGIEESAFAGSGLTSVSIPEGITEIKSQLFEGCSRLASISLPSSIQNIGYRAFYNCSGLTIIELPEGLKDIGTFAFYGCSGATQLILPSTLLHIGSRAFQNCSGLSSITSKALAPPACYNSESYTFAGVSRAALLYVPTASLNKYKNAYVWSEFYNIFPISE